MRKLIRSIVIVIAVLCVALVAVIVVNQSDEALDPELQKILSVEQKITPEQVQLYKELKESKVCNAKSLTPELRQALQKIITAGGLVIPKPEVYGVNCLSYFLGDRGDEFFATMTDDLKLRKETALDTMRDLLSALANTVSGDNLLITRMVALSALKQSLERIDKMSRVSVVGFMGLSRSLIPPEVISVIQKSPLEIIKESEGSELRMTEALIENSRKEESSIDFSRISENAAPAAVPFAKIIWSTYQRNRTMNRLYNRWELALATDKICLDSGNCPEEQIDNSLSFKDYIINPAGNSITKLMSPRLSKTGKKISDMQEAMKKLIEQMDKPGAPK